MKPEEITSEALYYFNIEPEELDEIYKAFNLYAKLMYASKNPLKQSHEGILCEPCRKYVKKSSMCNHLKTKMHLRNINNN